MSAATQRVAKARTKVLLKALDEHRRRDSLIAAGKQRDSLLRALIPLYVMRSSSVRVTSGGTQRMWASHGVKVHASVMAKALYEHVGFSRRTLTGVEITPNGVKYVEAAIR